MKFTLDLSKLSPQMRWRLLGEIKRACDAEAWQMSKDLQSWHDKTGEAYASMEGWLAACKSLSSQCDEMSKKQS